MIFKRIIYCVAAFLLSCSLGLFISGDLAHGLGLPTEKLWIRFLLSFFVGLVGTLIFYGASQKLIHLAEETDPDFTQQQQQWAWLKPAGVVARSPYPINKEQIIIGRDITSDILLCNDSISRRHAEVLRSAEGWSVHDLGSSNGTFVNGQRIEAETLLADGDVITLGDVNLTFEGPRRPLPQTSPERVSSMRPIDPQSLGLDDLDTQVQTSSTLPVNDPNTEVWRPRPDGSRMPNEFPGNY